MHRWLGFAGLLLALTLGSAGSADAALRSPHLSSSCPESGPYEERVFGPWRVEGCAKEGNPQGDETTRWLFKGTLEVNGMLVEGSENLVATIREEGNTKFFKLHRPGNAKLVLDPQIGGSRRRFVLYSGAVNLETSNSLGQDPGDSPGNPRDVDGVQPAATEGGGGTVDLPVSGVPALLGLRIRDRIEDAEVSKGSGGNPGSITFKPPTSLGSTASALLRDWTGSVTVKTVDGTGMKIEDLRFKIPGIEIPGIGGFDDLSIEYSAAADEWSGSIGLDLGEPLFTLDLAMSVSASTGAPTAMAVEVGGLNVPIGQTGIFLQSVSAAFDTNPLVMGIGATATAGPEFAGVALIEIGGDLVLQLEPNFRLEADGRTRVLPVGANSELATGDMHLIIDSNGFISIGGNAHYQVLFAGVGISADIGGSGAYATDDDKFNIEAHAAGRLHLGFIGSFDIVRFGAVVSNKAWAVCGKLNFLVTAGVGQEWSGNPRLFMGCDLSPFDVNINGARVAQDDAQTSSFVVPKGVRKLAVEVTADGPEPQLRLVDPAGNPVAATVPLGNRVVSNTAAVIAPPGSNVQYVFVRKPAAGRWKVQWAAGAPQVTGVRIARDARRLKAKVSVARVKGRPGRRRLRIRKLTGLARGERLVLGIRTPAGIVPIAETGARKLNATFNELGPGRRAIVASVVRDGIPIPGRTRVIARYRASLPSPPRKVRASRRKRKVVALALPRRSAELPQRWQYVLRTRGRPIGLARAKPGKPAKFTLNVRPRGLTVSVRPVLRGRALRGKAKTVRVR